MEKVKFGKCCAMTALTFCLFLSSLAVLGAEQVIEGKSEALYIDGLNPCEPLAFGRMQLKSNSTLTDPAKRRTSMIMSVATIVDLQCPGTQDARIDFMDELGGLLDCLVVSRDSATGVSWEVESCTAAPKEPVISAKQFGIIFWLEFAFVLGLMGLAYAFFRWANSARADAWLQLPTSISSIAQVLFDIGNKTVIEKSRAVQTGKQGMVILSGDEISLRFRIPVYPGVFNHNGSLARCVIAYVPVPPGMIARVETQSGSVSLNRTLDTGRVLTIKDENLDDNWVSVFALERSARWHVTVKNGIKTSDDYPVRLQLAVHSSIHTPADNSAIDRVFEEYSSYRKAVSDWARDTLTGILQDQSYDQSMRHCDEIVDSLNRHWRSASVGRLSGEVRDAISTRFTAFVIKPRQEAEATRFRPIFNRVHAIEKEIRDINVGADYQIQELSTKITNKIREINTYIGNLDGRKVGYDENMIPVSLEEHEKSFAKRLEENANAVGSHFKLGAEREELLKITRSPFADGASLLKSFGEGYVDACTQLSDLIRQVRTEQRSALNSMETLTDLTNQDPEGRK